jgi:hypothetical protein
LLLDARLTPGQRALALEQLGALGRRWLATAEQNLDCAF